MTNTTDSISWIVERDILSELGDRRTRAILAIVMARRCAGLPVFFVPPHIATRFLLSPHDLSWALRSLDGQLVETVGSTKGKFRRLRLLPEWEKRATATSKTAQPDNNRESKRDVPGRKARSTDGYIPAVLDPAVEQTLLEIAREQVASKSLNAL